MSATFDDGFDRALNDAGRQLKVVEGGKGKRKGGGGDAPPPESPPPEDLDWSAAPVECLGVNGETWWFVDAYRQIIAIQAGKLSARGALNALLGGDATGWAARYFPEFDKEGMKTGDYSPRKLHKALAEQMTVVGLFDPTTPRRGPGVWLHQGKPVVHAGANVFFADGARRPSFIRDGIAYIAARAILKENIGARMHHGLALMQPHTRPAARRGRVKQPHFRHAFRQRLMQLARAVIAGLLPFLVKFREIARRPTSGIAAQQRIQRAA